MIAEGSDFEKVQVDTRFLLEMAGQVGFCFVV